MLTLPSSKKIVRQSTNPTALSIAVAFIVPALNSLCATSPLYPAVVKGDGALGYYRFNDSAARTTINVNIGSLGAAGNATNDLSGFGVVHSIPGAIVGDPDRAAFYDFTTRTEIPFNAALNPPNTQPFTVEAWLLPVNDQDTTSFGGMGVLCNRWTAGGNRQGWVMYERRPNSNYSPAGEGLGWEFRMYDDLSTSTRLDVISQAPFTLGKWQHVVIVYDPVLVSNATLTIYIDGVQANQSTWNGGGSGTAQATAPARATMSVPRSVNRPYPWAVTITGTAAAISEMPIPGLVVSTNSRGIRPS